MDFEGCRLLFGVSGCLKTLAVGLAGHVFVFTEHFVVRRAALADNVQTRPAPIGVFGAEGLGKRFQPADIHGLSVIASPSVPFRQQAVDLFGQHIHSVFQFGDALAVAWSGMRGRLHQKQGGKNSKGFVHGGFYTDGRDLCCLKLFTLNNNFIHALFHIFRLAAFGQCNNFIIA